MNLLKTRLMIKTLFSRLKFFIKNYFLILCLLILPAILSYIFITLYGVSVVYLDAWARIPLLEHLFNNTLTFSDLFAQHNEHRLFFFNIIFLIITPLTHWNVIVQMYLSWIFIILSCVLFFYLNSRYWGISKQSLIKFLPIPWLLFSFRQWESILQGEQYCVYLCIFGFVLSIIFIELSEKIDYKFGIALIGGIVSTFSFFNGLLIWPIGFLLIFLIKDKKKMFLTIWGLTGVVCYFIYFFNWIKPPYHPSILYVIEHPITGIEYFVANVGSPLGYDYVSSISMGIILIVIACCLGFFLLKYNLIKQNAIWLSLIFFSLGSSLMMTMGRAGFGVIQAITSRYVSFTVIGIIGLYLLALAIYSTYDKNANLSIILGIIIGIILFGIIVGYISGIGAAEYYKDSQEKLVNYLIGYSTGTDDQLQQLYPSPSVVRERAKFLENYHLNVFYSQNNEYKLNKPVPVQILSGQQFFTGSGKIDDENKYIIFEHPLAQNQSLFYFVNPPVTNKSVLHFSIALDPNVWSPDKGDGVEYQIYVNSVASENLIFSQYIDPKNNLDDRKWNDREVNMSQYAGKNITLIFSTLPGPKNDTAYDWAWWGTPRITNMD